MRLRLRRHFFSVTGGNGRCRQFRYRWLLPFVAVPLVFAVALLFFSEGVVVHHVLRSLGFEHANDKTPGGGTAGIFWHVQRKSIENLFAAEPAPTASELPTLRLFMPNNALDELQAAINDTPSRRPYRRAVLIDEHGHVYNATARLRGAGAWHHLPEKPSLRVRLKKSEVREGRRYIELQRAEDVLALKNWIPAQLGHELGLLSERPEHVRLFVNQKYFGVYLRTMRPGEPLALEHGRMPGTFFKGEFSDSLWLAVRPWTKFGDNPDGHRLRFRRFLDVVGAGQDPRRCTPALLHELWELLDFERYALWAALMAVTGGVHDDFWHNHVFFMSPNHGPMEPVVWDANAFGVHVDPDLSPDSVRHPIMATAIADPRWRHRRNQRILELLEGPCRPDRMRTMIDAAVARMLPDLRADRHLSSLEFTNVGWDLVPWSVCDIEPKQRELEDYAAQRVQFLSRYLSAVQVGAVEDSESPGATIVTVYGNVGVRVERLDGAPVRTDSWSATQDLLYPGLGVQPYRHVSLRFARPCGVNAQMPSAMRYHVAGKPADLRFRNAITGQPVTVGDRLQRTDAATLTMRPAMFDVPAIGDLLLGPGEVVLDRDVHTAPGQRLVVQPGTRLRLRKGVGIYAEGPTIAVGAPDAWIEISAADREPWAAFGVHGAQTAGSRFAYLRVDGGSVGTHGTVDFKGMFSVYECPDVELRHCRFGRNEIGDDAVNLAQSTVIVEDSLWEGALADALDLDMCEGVVRRCRFIRSGNDGIDLMASRVALEENVFEASGDKGISVGEGTQAVVRSCRISACTTGVEIKDHSRLLLQDSTLRGNGVAVRSYQKKWIYGQGGTTALTGCTIEASREADLSIAERSSVVLIGTRAAMVAADQERITTVESLDAEWDDLVGLQR